MVCIYCINEWLVFCNFFPDSHRFFHSTSFHLLIMFHIGLCKRKTSYSNVYRCLPQFVINCPSPAHPALPDRHSISHLHHGSHSPSMKLSILPPYFLSAAYSDASSSPFLQHKNMYDLLLMCTCMSPPLSMASIHLEDTPSS